jgi:hypothetical protein
MKKHILSLSIFTLILGCSVDAQQQINLLEMGDLPLEVEESSGLAVAGEQSLWTHNDHGNKNEIYEISLRGELIRTVKLTNILTEDMEDMAQDDEGIIYIGDTGNNKMERFKLQILKIDPRMIHDNKVRPEVIEFLLPDNALQSDCHYDIEAITWDNGNIVMFTKDRCGKLDNHMVIYSVPDQPGHYTAVKLGEFYWEDHERSIVITAADVSPDGKKLVLLSNDALHFFFAYKKQEYFNGSYRYIPLENSKKEALVHMDDCDIYITEESREHKKAKLWKLNLCSIGFD